MTASLLRRCIPAATGLICFTLASCSSTKKSGDYSGVVDYTTPDTNLSQEEYPFDEKGNYLADVVSGKRKGSKNKKIDPPKSNPETYERPPEPVVAAAPTPASSATPKYETPPATDPYAPVYSSGSTTSTASGLRTRTGSSTAQSRSTTSASSSSSKSKAKTKVVAKAKPKPASKPKPHSSSVSYTIRKGDTLYALANRYGTSVAAIKRASRLSSDTLRDGRTLKIPRK